MHSVGSYRMKIKQGKHLCKEEGRRHDWSHAPFNGGTNTQKNSLESNKQQSSIIIKKEDKRK